MPKPYANAGDLAFETLTKILTHVASANTKPFVWDRDARAAMVSCGAVCRYWRLASLPFLWDTATISFLGDVEPNYAKKDDWMHNLSGAASFFRTETDVGQHVHSVTLRHRCPGVHVVDPEDLLSLLACFPNLQSLRLQDMLLPWPLKKYKGLPAPPVLQRLWLDCTWLFPRDGGLPEFSFQDMLSPFGLFEHAEEVRIAHVNPSETTICRQTCRCKTETLSLRRRAGTHYHPYGLNLSYMPVFTNGQLRTLDLALVSSPHSWALEALVAAAGKTLERLSLHFDNAKYDITDCEYNARHVPHNVAKG